MDWCSLCLFLALVTHASLVQGKVASCSRVAFQPFSKSLTCDNNCDSHNVTWHVEEGEHEATFRPDGNNDVSQDSFFFGQFEVTSQGQLYIQEVRLDIHKATYNCTAFDQSGEQCGTTDRFDLKVFQLFTTLSEDPIIDHIDARFMAGADTLIYGTRKVLCASGNSPGIRVDGTFWEKTDVINENVLNVTAQCPDCTSCDDEEKLLSIPSVVNQSDHNYSAYLVALSYFTDDTDEYRDCFDTPNVYISFLVINSVQKDDGGGFEFNVVSKDHRRKSDFHYTTIEYKVITPVIHSPMGLNSHQVPQGKNGYVVCDATTTNSQDAALQWIFKSRSSLVRQIDSVVLNSSDISLENISISDEELNYLCGTYAPLLDEDQAAFSIKYAPNDALLIPSAEHDGALVLRQLLLLVVCSVSSRQEGKYSCLTLDKEESVQLIVSKDSSSAAGTNPGAIAGVVVCAVIIIIVMFIMLVWGHRRYRQLKYEAMQMRPMVIPLAATQLTTAINQAFSSFSPIGSPMYDKFEFQRENLMLLEVIGEGQFGQVWRARAIGICSEDSRNIVAVKTLKDTYRDSDYFDLRTELDIMKRMEPHPNIINLLGVCSEMGEKPMCILMEYAAYGSMKDYLAYCCRVMQAHAEGLTSPTLHEAYPSAAASNGGILRQSMLMGDYPKLLGRPLGGNDYNYDPMVASRTRRLTKMLQSEGYRPNPSDEAPLSYDRLEPVGEAAGVSLYDKLYPQSQCVYRPCLETYNYACYRGAGALGGLGNTEQEYYNNPEGEYYNQGGLATEARGQGASDGASPPVFSPTDREPPMTPHGLDTAPLLIETSPPAESIPTTRVISHSTSSPVRKKVPVTAVLSTPQLVTSEPPLHSTAISNSQDNVFDEPNELGSSNLMAPNKEHLRESMISFPDGYIYAPASTVNGGYSVSDVDGGAVGGAMGGGEGGREEVEEKAEKKEKLPPPLMEDMITHLDLLDFAVQIARGMDHLQRMQCVHRDLAARNILIAEDFTLKIGDFGLARDLSDKDYYRKVTPGRLPARWMAPESLVERTHTYQSDVWSYAVVLWEILTYGEVPYRGLTEANDCDHLAYYLRSGNRLPRPPNAADEFHNLMTACWAMNPDKRPPFTEIMSILDNHLSAAHGYLTMASADQRASSVHDPAGGASSANPSPRMQKRKAMLQKLDKLQGADRPVSLQPGAFSKSKLAKSPSLPIVEPLGTLSAAASAADPTSNPTSSAASPYLLPTPTSKIPGITVGDPRLLPGPSNFYKFGSNPELSSSPKEPALGAAVHGAGGMQQNQNGGVKVNGLGTHTHNSTAAGEAGKLETQL